MENFEMTEAVSDFKAKTILCLDYPTMQHNAISAYVLCVNMRGHKDPKNIFRANADRALRACQINALRMGDY